MEYTGCKEKFSLGWNLSLVTRSETSARAREKNPLKIILQKFQLRLKCCHVFTFCGAEILPLISDLVLRMYCETKLAPICGRICRFFVWFLHGLVSVWFYYTSLKWTSVGLSEMCLPMLECAIMSQWTDSLNYTCYCASSATWRIAFELVFPSYLNCSSLAVLGRVMRFSAYISIVLTERNMKYVMMAVGWQLP